MATETVGIALGSNLGNRILNFRSAVRMILAFCRERKVITSSVYETEPVDCLPESEAFYNAVIEVKCPRPPRAILEKCLAIEQTLGRVGPGRQRNAPRTIDLDILYYGEHLIKEPDLEIPHPKITTRRFVLEPLCEIRPGMILPGEMRSVEEMLADLGSGEHLKKIFEAGMWL